jgi:murein DD-endopeptidase MepM/ murein hydrolase activator NlpD
MTPVLRATLPTFARATLPASPNTLSALAATVRATAPAIARATLRGTALAFAVTVVALALPPQVASATPPNEPPPRAASPQAAPPGVPPPQAAPLSGVPLRGVWPLSPRPEIVRGFEPPPKPWLPGHRGLDLAGSPGQPVLAATAGTITYAGPLAGRGVVVVTSGPFRTTYEPVSPSIQVGATVTPGDQLGTLSTAGTHCPPRTCLHWGLRQATTYLDPLLLLGTRPVRLLPLPHDAPNSAPGGVDHAAPPSPAAGGEDRPAPATSTAVGEDPAAPTSPTGVRSSPASVRGSAADRSTGLVPAVVVGVSAVLSLGGALLIRRH